MPQLPNRLVDRIKPGRKKQDYTAALQLPWAPYFHGPLTPPLWWSNLALLSTLRGWGSFERVGKPAEQGGQSLNRLDWAVTSPPSSSVPLLAHRAEAEASQNKRFYYTMGGMGPEGNRGAGGVWCWRALGGTAKMEQLWLPVPGQVGAHSREKRKRQHRPHSHFHSSHPPPRH